MKSVDKLKDQTFFLSQIDPEMLKRTLFPIGHFQKDQIRQIAKENGLDRVWKKKGSVGICFIGKRNFNKFIDQYLPRAIGPIIDIDSNEKIGEHTGVHHYTIGQRLHEKIQKAHIKPYFVANKEVKTQNLYVVSFLIEYLSDT
jgi:tRNA U34 2-thiouridine synthase MnmA/TrmU